MPSKKRDSSKIWLILCGVLVVGVCGALAALIATPKKRPKASRSRPEVQDAEVTSPAPATPEVASETVASVWEDRLAAHDGRLRRYNRTVVEQQRLGPGYRRSLFKQFSKNRRRFARLRVRRAADGCREDVENCPEIADDDLTWKELALLGPLLESGSEGDEWDRIVRPESGSDLRATVWWEPGHTILISSYVPVGRIEVPARQPRELAGAFGLREVASRSARWAPEELGKVSAALGLLDSSEAALLRDVTFAREGIGDAAGKSGLYSYADGDETITLYDTAFRGDSRVFRGSPSAPHLASFFPVLHEVGHLIAHRPETAAGRELNSAIDRYNGLVERHNRSVKAGDHQAAERMGAQLGASETAVNDARARLEASRDLVVKRFMEARTLDAGPTEYGETSPDEAFAESYALHKLDPEALIRIDPAAARFFAEGEHLRAQADSGGAATD